jgi:hypothetical protein
MSPPFRGSLPPLRNPDERANGNVTGDRGAFCIYAGAFCQ